MRMAYAAEGRPIPMPASKPASCRKTSRCCRKPRTRLPAAIRTERTHPHRQEGRDACKASCATAGQRPTKIKAIASKLGARGRDGGLKEGQKLRDADGAGRPGQQRQQPIRVIVANETAIEAVVALSDLGKYVAVDVQSFNSVTETASKQRR